MFRRCLLLTLILIFALASRAQVVSVSSFALNETDLTANQHGTTVYDQNGEKCALIRVQTTQTGFSFDVGSLGVSKVDYKTAEVWVYVPHGVRKIIIRHQLLGTTEYAFPINIERARTYKMQLTTGEVQTIVKNAVTSQYVLFRLSPANAFVELDGQIIDVVDGTATKRMPFGTYNYKVQAPRHAPEVGTIVVNDPKNKHIVTVNLRPQFGNVKFQVANNAEIWIDDKKQGIGNCTVELGYGTYVVECRLPGHRASQKEISITQESVNTSIILAPPTPIYGSLDINSSPADAEVWLDDKQVGTTPLFLSECLVGEHKLKVSKSGFKDYTQTITITEGQTETEVAKLEEGFSTDATTFTVNGVSFKMVFVEGGSFMMGAPDDDDEAWGDDKPAHKVTLDSYYIAETEVTQELWQAVMGSNPSYFKGDIHRPVETVSWNDCQEFIKKLNTITGRTFSIPTEAQWEYAARGGKNSKGYKFSGSNNLGDVAWYGGNSNSTPHPVAQKQSNELGLYDMTGNVWEWCQDWFDSNYYANSPQNNPQGPSSGDFRVLRGGSWDNGPRFCRVSCRGYDDPYYGGLRLSLPV